MDTIKKIQEELASIWVSVNVVKDLLFVLEREITDDAALDEQLQMLQMQMAQLAKIQRNQQ